MRLFLSASRVGLVGFTAISLLSLLSCGKSGSTETPAPATMTDGVSFSASPNPIPTNDGSHLGITKLSWNTSKAAKVELHVSKPDGPLLCKGLAAGSCDTAKWVVNGMEFYLQDGTSASPTASSATLATVKVAVQ